MTFWEEQMAQEPTRLYYEKLKEIIYNSTNHVTRDFNCLEIGLDVGISARCFLEFSNIKLTSVDPGEVDIGLREIGNMEVGDRWRFFPMFSDEFFKTCIWNYDIIFIDGDHSYEQTKRDFHNAWIFLRLGGILIGHDFLHQKNFTHDKDYGVTRAVCEFIKDVKIEATIYPPNPGLITIRK